MSANSNLLDKFLDENNNWFSEIDNLSASMQFSLPEPTFSFKSGLAKPRSDAAADEPVTCKLSNNLNNPISPQQQQPQQLTKQSVKRALFVEKDEIDHETNLKLVQMQLDQLLAEDCKRWNFDFKNNRPLHNKNSQYEWQPVGESVLSKLDLNRSAVDAATTTMNEPIKSSRPTVSKPAAQSASRGHGAASSSICNKAVGKLSNSNSTITSIATRSSSLKRKLMNIDGTCLFLLYLEHTLRKLVAVVEFETARTIEFAEHNWFQAEQI